MVSIKDIAEKCSVSIATVSKALNDHSDVSEATKRLVCKTAAEMGYFPNAQARALKTNRTYSIGVLFVDKAESGFENVYFSSVLQAFRVEAEKNGYDIMFINHKIGNRNMSYLEHCRYRGFDGLFAACADFNDDSVRELFESDIPLVAIDYVSEKKMSVCSDNAHGVKELTEYVISQGHKKVAFICGDDSQVTDLRLNSFLDTMKNHGIEVNQEYVKHGRYLGIAENETVVSELLEMNEPPTCIFFPDDFSTISAFAVAEKKGVKIPDDVSIVGYDGAFAFEALPFSLTTIVQDSKGIGQRAAELLIDSIEKKREIQKDVLIRGTMHDGGTVKKI